MNEIIYEKVVWRNGGSFSSENRIVAGRLKFTSSCIFLTQGNSSVAIKL
jgi:hypothetical protein